MDKLQLKDEREKLRVKVQKLLDDALEDNIAFMLLHSIHKYLLDDIKHLYPMVASDEYTIKTKVYFAIHCLEDFPKCHNEKCNNTFEHRNVLSIAKGFRKYCCKQCMHDSDERKRLYVETCRKNYGVDNISQYEGTKRKKEEKALKKYGVRCVSQAPEVQAAIAVTNINRYGAKIYLASQQGIEHRRRTCLDRYGVDSFSKTPMHVEKMKEENRKNYGVDWPQQNREFMRQMQKRYTYDNINFDSLPELAIYIYCKDKNIEFTYQPSIVFYYEHNGIKHAYEPDFLLEGQLVEVKGDQFFKEDGTMQNPFDHAQDALYEAKHQCMLANNVKIWTYDIYSIYVKYIEPTYGKDYLKQFKNK